MEATTKDILTTALRGAADAHAVHEATDLGGVYDEQWPEWYAEHMAHALGDAGYRLVESGEADEG
jgi:hypothetical protein